MDYKVRMPEQNLVVISGRATRDPEVKYTASGAAVCHFGIASSRRYKKKDSSEWVEDTTFINVSSWGDYAKDLGRKLKKGDPVFVTGRIVSNKWEGKDGTKRETIEIRAEKVQVLRVQDKEAVTPATAEQAIIGTTETEDEPIPF